MEKVTLSTPCRYGHVGQRSEKNLTCLQCSRENDKKRNKQRVKYQNRRYKTEPAYRQKILDARKFEKDADPEGYYRKQKDEALRKNYGINLDQYEILAEVQNHRCKICNKPEMGKALAVDHNHGTGKIRGLLCQNCNMGLGKFQDSVEFLSEAIKYLKVNV